MKAFTVLTGVAAPLPIDDVDTDKIVPSRFLKTISRKGLAGALFNSMRFGAKDHLIPEFILNRAPWNHAAILVSGRNFGCGSSREHAPWALDDFGIRCIIARSFADIFYNNCLKNGILPLVLEEDAYEQVLQLSADPKAAEMTVDLVAQEIKLRHGVTINFSIDPLARRKLLEGADDITAVLRHSATIDAFERNIDVRLLPPITDDLIAASGR